MTNIGNICVFDNKIQGGFTQIAQWVTMKCLTKKNDPKTLSLEALGMYTLLKSLPPHWVTSFKLLQANTGLKEYTIRKLITELIDNNMLRRMERFEGGRHFHYFVFSNESACGKFEIFIQDKMNSGEYPSVDEILDYGKVLDEQIYTNEQKPDSDLSKCEILHQQILNEEILNEEILDEEILDVAKQTTYTILDNNNIINNTKLYNNNISINKVDCEKTSQNNFKTNIKKPFSIKKSDVISSSYQTKPNLFSVTDNGAAEVNLGSKRRNKDVVKNKVQLMEIQKGDSISTMDTQGFKNTMGDLTVEDNQMARVTHSMQEFLALEKKVNKTNMQKMTRLKQLKKEINKLGANPSVASNLETYVESYMDTYGLLATASLHAKYDKLKAITYGNPDMMNAIINDAIQGNWKDFHVSDDIEKKFKHIKNDSIKNIQTVIDTNDDDDYAVDDNGNLLQY